MDPCLAGCQQTPLRKGEGKKKKTAKGLFLKCATRCRGKVRHYCAAEAAGKITPPLETHKGRCWLWLLTHARFLLCICTQTSPRKCFHHKPGLLHQRPDESPSFFLLTSRWCCTSWPRRGWRQRANRQAACRVGATLASAFSYKIHSHNYLMKRSQTCVG